MAGASGRWITPGRIVKIVLLCFVVGLILSALGLGAEDVWRWLADMAERAYRLGRDVFTWAWPYILIGAGIVIPIVLLRLIWRWVARR